MHPDKAQYRPFDAVVLTCPPGTALVVVKELGHEAARLPVTEDGRAEWTAPAVGETHARGFRAEALGARGEVLDATAFDVARHWSVAPRYGFLSEFKPTDTAEAVEGLNRLHLNVVQYYDWMYTHYQYSAPTEEFVDPLGRQTSHRVVREKIAACRRHGIASLAYGSMYGGEKPIALEHPEWLLYDGNGEPYHLIDLFYIQNFARGCGWREMILGEYEGAVTLLGFDGIHIDQYGFPKRALYRPAPGEEQMVDLTREMPDFVVEACERIRRIHPDGGNIFNCVNNWPVERIAPLRDADQATYVEVWSPFDAYRDLHELVRHAKAAGPHKQVILSAYLKPFHREAERPEGAMSGLRLATAAIYAAGGFHLLLGEGDGVLADAYYPMFGRLSAADLSVVQRYYDFVVAYGELLHDMELRDVTHAWMGGGFNAETRETNCEAPVGTSPHAEPGKVWTILHEKPSRRVLNLINLHGLAHDQWRQPQAEPVPVAGIQVQFQIHTPIRAIWCASPDNGGAPCRLAFERVPDGRPYVRFEVPRLDTWTVVWTEE